MSNNNMVLISGKSATGKSLSLRGLKNQKGVMYLNCENNKALPFKNSFSRYTITDPLQIYDGFTAAEADKDIHTIVVDTLTFLMDMYETLYVLEATNGMKAWGNYAQYFKKLMAQYVAKSTKDIVFTAHTLDVLNEAEMVNETLVKVKGSLMNQGIESFFTNVISTKKLELKKLDKYQSKLLNITDEEEMLGIKYVYQTRLTKDTVNERIRSPMGMWNIKETYIDNDISLVMKRIHEYYS